jgi:hypothetical protein
MSRGFRAVFGDNVGFIWERSKFAMNFLKKNFLSFVLFSTYLFVAGCNVCDDCEGSFPKKNYALINNTNGPLYYKAYIYETLYNGIYYNDTLYFDTTLSPNDTLFLYSWKFTPPMEEIYDHMGFRASYVKNRGVLTIKDDNDFILYYRSNNKNCGSNDFVSEMKDNAGSDPHWIVDYYHYWTIDSTYIAEKSCKMSLDVLREIYLDEVATR